MSDLVGIAAKTPRSLQHFQRASWISQIYTKGMAVMMMLTLFGYMMQQLIIVFLNYRNGTLTDDILKLPLDSK